MTTSRPDQSENGEGSGDRTTRPHLPDLGDSRYVIQELVGEGGMGYVYRAVDRQLDRTVAIKAIRPSLASRPEVVKRLAREAKFAAQLDHPFICKVHELIQQEDGQALLVMEYVEGETLKSVLKTVPLDLSSVVRLARELADALGFAHQRGLLHRDIKPGNIIMTLPGHIKVMDFGVAKALDADLSTTSTLTEHGHVVGTPAYMSPEQAAGEAVDHRSDIFSFGVLLYECISGHLPFEGSTAAAYLRQAALGHPKPLPKHVPAELRAIVLRCLAKSPGDRYESFDAVRKELDAASLSLISAESHLTFSQRLRLGPRWWVAAVVFGIVVAAFFLVDWLRPRDEEPGRVRVQSPVVTWPSVEEGSRVSPDGTAVAFVSNQGGGYRLWIRSATGNEPKAITNVHEAIKTPAWSPNSQQLAYLFRHEGQAWLQIISTWGESTGPARPIGGAWDDVGLARWIGSRIYFGVSAGSTASVLWRRDTANGKDERVTHASGKLFKASGQTVNLDVRLDEARIVFVPGEPDAGIWVGDLDGRNAERLPIDANLVLTPRWKGPDWKRIVYVANENGQADLWEYRLDARTKVALTTSPLEEEAIDVSASGRVIVADTVEQVGHLWAVDLEAASGPVQLTNDSRTDLWPSLATSSDRMIFHRRQGAFVVSTPVDTEIIAARWADRRMVTGEVIGPGTAGSISADGRRVFLHRGIDATELWVKDLDSPEPSRKVADGRWFSGSHVSTWAPIGQTAVWAPRGSSELFFVRRVAGATPTFEVVRATITDGKPPVLQVLATATGEQRYLDLSVSDDGARLAVVSAGRRPYQGGSVLLLDLNHPEAPPSTAYTTTAPSMLNVKGWTRRGTLVVVKTARPDLLDVTEILEVSVQGSSRQAASVPGLRGMTAVLDAARDRLFATGVAKGLASVLTVSLERGAVRPVVPNEMEGITFGGYAVTADGRLVFMKKETNYDVWMFDFAGPNRAGTSQGGSK